MIAKSAFLLGLSLLLTPMAGCDLLSEDKPELEPPKLFVAVNHYADSVRAVAVIDPETDEVTGEITVCKGGFERDITSMAAAHGRLYVTCAGTLYEVDPASGKVRALYEGDVEVLSSRRGDVVLVSVGPSQEEIEYRRIGVLDVDSRTIAWKDTLQMSHHKWRGRSLALAPDRPLLYGFDHAFHLLAYDYRMGTMARRYDVRSNSYCIAVSPDGTRLYLLEGIVDLASGQWIAETPEARLGWLTVSPDGKRAYYSDFNRMLPPTPGTGRLRIFDTEKLEYEAEIDIRAQYSWPEYAMYDLRQAAVTKDGKRIYMSLYLRRVLIIDLYEHRVIKDIQLNSKAEVGPLVWSS